MPAEPNRASIHIQARPDEIFECFIRPDAMTRWMGSEARLDPQPGGEFSLDIPGVPIRGRYLVVQRPRRVIISWGHADSEVLPPGSSTVEVTFTPEGNGTLVTVVHSGLPELLAQANAAGWVHYLGRLAAVIRSDPNKATGRAGKSSIHPRER